MFVYVYYKNKKQNQVLSQTSKSWWHINRLQIIKGLWRSTLLQGTGFYMDQSILDGLETVEDELHSDWLVTLQNDECKNFF